MDYNYYWKYSFPMKRGILDDEYYFYEDGSIIHFYDQTQQKINIEEPVTADSIDIEKRSRMLEDCPSDKKRFIGSILKINI